MTQYSRPASDITTGWTTTPLWSKIDEDPYSDTDYITGTGASKTAECKLSAVTDPVSSVNHTWRTRLRATGSSSGEKVTLSLYQGSTLIATLINNSTIARGSFADWSGTLTAAQADAITNYSDLRFRWVTGSGNGTSETIDCSWAVLEVPDATSIYDESVTLSASKSVSDSLSTILDGSLSLGKSNSVSDANAGAANTILSTIQKSLAQYVADQSTLNGLVSLSIFRAITESTETAQTFDEAISLSRSMTQLVGNAGLIQALSSLPKALGISESVSSLFSLSVLVSLAKTISESPKVSASPSVVLSRSLQTLIQPKDIASSVLSWSKHLNLNWNSEKLLISYISLNRSASYSGAVAGNVAASLPLSIRFSYGLAGLLSVLDGIDLSKVSSLALVGALNGKEIDASLILDRLALIFSDGTLGIAITTGSVIIMDVELLRVLLSNFSEYQVKISDELL